MRFASTGTRYVPGITFTRSGRISRSGSGGAGGRQP